jgi:hypothetical protein
VSPAENSGAGWTPLALALHQTATHGVPTVVVVTSRSAPACQVFRKAFALSPEASEISRWARFAEVPAEIYPDVVQKLDVKVFPTFVVYRQGKTGVEPVGCMRGLREGREVFGWLASLVLGQSTQGGVAAVPGPRPSPGASPSPDPSLTRTANPGRPSADLTPPERRETPPPSVAQANPITLSDD